MSIESGRLHAASVVVLLAVVSLHGCGGGGDGNGNGDVTVLHETCGADICSSPPACGEGEVLTCCTCVKVPVQDAVRTTCSEISEYCAETATPVDISCYQPDGYPAPVSEGAGGTLHGPVDVYATGGSSDGVLVQVYRVAADGSIGDLVGESVSTLACADHETAGEFPEVGESTDEATDCPGPCQEKISADNADCRTLGYYTMPGVPTGIPLIVKTSQDGGGSLWKDMLSFNIWFFESDVGADGGAPGHLFYKARVISTDDWRNIPVAAGDTSGIAPGYAAVAGEVHDCGDVRLAFAMAGSWPEASTLTYFNGVEEHLYPNTMRSAYGTNIDGLYAAIEIDPETTGAQIVISAIAQVEGIGVVSLGWQEAWIYPDTLTSVTLRGTRPDQVP